MQRRQYNRNMDEATINDRIQTVVDCFFGGNKARFAKAIGEPATSVSNVLTRRRSVPSALTLQRICTAVAGLSAEWLLAGRGPMCVEAGGACGGGSPYYDADFQSGADELWDGLRVAPAGRVSVPPLDDAGVWWCRQGDAAMEPEIGRGDLIALREVTGWDRFLVFGRTYAVVTQNGQRLVRRLCVGGRPGCFRLVAARSGCEEQEIGLAMVRRLFLVEACVRRF